MPTGPLKIYNNVTILGESSIKLDVIGDITASGNMYASGDIKASGNVYATNDITASGNLYGNNIVYNTGDQTISGYKRFEDNVYINNLFVTGVETIINTTNTNVASNYMLINLTGGIVDGGIFFVTGSGLTGINDSGAIIGFDHSDKFKFGISTRASDLNSLSTIASFEEMTGISGELQTQISTLNNQTGSYATQVYVTGISGELQTQIDFLAENSNNIIGLSIFL